MKNTFSIIVVILVIIGGYFLLNKNKEVQNISSTKIGVLLPLSGSRADAGELSKNAIEIAKEEISADKERKNKLEFIYEDTKYEPQTAVSAATKLIDLDKVHYIIGPGGSSEALAVAPIVEKSKVVLIVHGAQSDEISDAGDYVFRIVHNSRQEAPIFAEFVSENMKGNKLHFLAMNTAAIDSYLKNFTPTFEAGGKTIGKVEKFDTKVIDFKDLLIKLKSENPTDIFILAVPKQTGIILKQAGELGIKVKFWGIGSEGSEITQIGGSMAEGYTYPYSYDHTMAGERVKKFYDKYIEKFGKQPDALAANAYDATYLLSDCIEKVGDNSEKVKQCLYSVKDFEGAGGKFSIDSKGDAIKEIFIKTVKNGQFIKLEQ